MSKVNRYIAILTAIVMIGVVAVGCDQTEDGINNGIITGLIVGAGLWGITQAGDTGGGTSLSTSDELPTVVRYGDATGVGLGYTGGGTTTDTGGGTGSGFSADYLSSRFPALTPLPTQNYLGNLALEVTRFNPVAFNIPMNLPAKDSGTVSSEQTYSIFFGTIRNWTGTVVNPSKFYEERADPTAEDYYVPGIDFTSLTFYVDYYDFNGKKLFSDLWTTDTMMLSSFPTSKLEYPTSLEITDSELADSTNPKRYNECGFYLKRKYDERIYTARIRKIEYAYDASSVWLYYGYNLINVEQFNRKVTGYAQPFTYTGKVLGNEPKDPDGSNVRIIGTFFDKYDNVVDVQLTSSDLEFSRDKDPNIVLSNVAKFEVTSNVDFERFQLNWTIVPQD